MRILYFDCFSGMSGDMTVGALRDLGVEEKVFLDALDALGLGSEFHAHFCRDARQNVTGWRFDVHMHEHDHGHSHEHEGHADLHGHDHSHTHDGHTHSHAHEEHTDSHGHGHSHEHGRSYRQIRELIEGAALSDFVKERAASVFRRIAEAEGRIHGIEVEEVTFHEVGAVDSIADIVAACAGIEALGVDQVAAAVPVEGSGWIDCAHGKFPLPAPATLEILAGIPLRQIDEPNELLTPTGAALLAEFSTGYGVMPEMKILKSGYGIGTRDTHPRPNVLRAVLGETEGHNLVETDEITQIETNIDDLSPELAGAVMDSLFAAGALDVFFSPAQMKKNRPGYLFTVLATDETLDGIVRVLLTETSSFGVRMVRAKRAKLRREFRDVETPYGSVRIKLGFLGDELVQAAPEYESCRDAAKKSGVSVKDVHLAAWIGTSPSPEK